MTHPISHHIPSEIVAAYAAGALPQAYGLVVAAHVSMCDTCRAELAAHEAVGGVVLEAIDEQSVSDAMRDSLFAMLDDPIPAEPAPIAARGIYPAPVMEALSGDSPKWKSIGGGVKQFVMGGDKHSISRLLFIPPGRAVPDHGHNGLELTLVLQGGYSDATGHFDVGDVEVAGDDLDHVPLADAGPPCIVLAATDAPLKFNAFLPRILQPMFGI